MKKTKSAKSNGTGNKQVFKSSTSNELKYRSGRFLVNYAIPFTRVIEAKLVNLQHRMEMTKSTPLSS